jgi:hypothetical protein
MLRAIGRRSAPWPTVACPLGCELRRPAKIRVLPFVEPTRPEIISAPARPTMGQPPPSGPRLQQGIETLA